MPCLDYLYCMQSFYLFYTKIHFSVLDSHLAYDAAAALAQYVFNLKSTKIADLLLDVPLPLCLSIFLLKSQPLEKTVHEAIANSGMKQQTVKDKFLPYPLLYNILFKSSAERSHPDITVYELLKVNLLIYTYNLFIIPA